MNTMIKAVMSVALIVAGSTLGKKALEQATKKIA